MDCTSLGKKFLALSACCEAIAQEFFDAAVEGDEDEASDGCQHPTEYRVPLRGNGRTGFACRACGVAVYDVTIDRRS